MLCGLGGSFDHLASERLRLPSQTTTRDPVRRRWSQRLNRWRIRRPRWILLDVEEGFDRRLFIPDRRGSGRYLRVTWHRDSATIVLSHWQDDVCLASTPVSLDDAAGLVRLVNGALN